ncbi:MAG: TVP38/TMEM64 family protein [Myxococcales bacterium]|nr:TVP38/TMEM64 family protein [Myxococcales bacterium]
MSQQLSSPALEPERQRRSGSILLRIAIGLLVLAALGFVAREVGDAIPRIAAWIEGLGFWAPVIFIAAYAASVVALVPASILTLAAGAIFGLLKGTVYTFIAATLGAIGAFLVARHLARGAVARRIARNPRFASIDRAIGGQGLKIVFLLRLSPVFPFSLLNYALGLTGVRLRDYALASLGMIPATLLYVYYGKLIGDVAALAGGAAVERDAAYWAVLILGLIATVAVTTVVTRAAHRALKEEVPDAADS